MPVLRALLFLFLSVFTAPTQAADTSYGHTILVINSYHHGFPWSDGIINGVVERFSEEPNPPDLQIEYLDTKRFSIDIAFPVNAEVIRAKGLSHIDAILVTDNNAFNFLRQYREDLFSGVPVVFSGVNNFAANMIQGDSLITGVAETTNPKANIEMLLRAHPKMKRMILISDETVTGLAEVKRFTKAIELIKESIDVEVWSRWTLADLKQRLASLSLAEDVIFRLPMHRDSTGLSMTLQESVNLLKEHSSVPVYSAWDTAISAGLVGGYVASAKLQGKLAADFLLEILSGKLPQDIPIALSSPSEPVLNELEAARFGLNANQYPQNTRIINPIPDQSYLNTYLGILGVALFVLLIAIYQWRVKRNEVSHLHEELDEVVDQSMLLRTLMDANSDHIFAKNTQGEYIDCNKAFVDFFGGGSRDHILGKKVEDFALPKTVEVSKEQDAQVLQKGVVSRRDVWAVGVKGVEQLFESIKTPLVDKQGSVVGLLGVNRNITDRYLENALLKKQGKILDMQVRGVPLNSIMHDLVAGIEDIYTDSICAVLLLNSDAKEFTYAANRKLSDSFIQATSGALSNDGCRVFSQVVQKAELVVTDDMMTSPDWEGVLEEVGRSGLKSCWAQPVMGTGDQVLGVFLVFHAQPKQPDKGQLSMLSQTARLVSLVLERKQVEGDLQKLSRAVEQSPTMVLITDSHGAIEYINEEFTEVTGYTQEELKGKTPSILNAGDATPEFYRDMWGTILAGNDWHGEIRNKTKTGQEYWSMLSISPIVDEGGHITHFIGVSEDISAQKQTQEQIEQLAFYDPLTLLGNRRLFREQLELEIKKTQRSGDVFALFYLDIDNFKQVNDTLGHDIGDRLLKAIAERLKYVLRNSDLISRLGGDEFIALLPGISGPKEAVLVAEKLLQVICEPIQLAGADVRVTVSLGITMAPTDGEEWSVLMKNADMAMYRAKRNGRNNFQFFTHEMNAEVLARATMERELKEALQSENFCLHYQPQWTLLAELQPLCMEALVRWQHPEKGMIPPNEFIPVAEELGLIVELGEYVLNQACKDGKALLDNGHQVRVAVNLSMRQFFDPGLLDKIALALDSHKFPARLLELEITESMIMEDVNQVINTLSQLKELGVSLSIDDFGTGYSSLSYLKQLPVDNLKIDASFVRDIPHDKDDMEITAAVIAMAHKLGLKVVAEGIETHDQLAFLRENGCELGQGFLLAKPMEIDSIYEILDVEFTSSS